ncbi:MAG: hydroxysqualene dehydroxylase HpnE [Neisseria sp.]|nr:hydroxysqualene dehydroxylase HpnE [Neisseria sp.]
MKQKKTAVIGAGWSGLAAAVRLVQAGQTGITLFEAGKTMGGRARTLAAGGEGFSFLDNGQHILLYAYHGVRELMETVGGDWRNNCLRLPLQWHLADGLRFQAARALPAPLHILWGVLRADGLRPADKTALLRQMRRLQKRTCADDTAVGGWLAAQGCSDTLLQNFWQPLVLGALNTPADTASLNTLQAVLQDGVWGGRDSSDYLLPKTDLGRLLALPAAAYLKRHGANLKTGCRVPRLRLLPDGGIDCGGERFDAVIPAAAAYHTAALLPPQTPPGLRAAFSGQTHHAITTAYLRYPQAAALPAVICGLAGGTVQWFFRRGDLGGLPGEVSAVISASDQIGSLPPEEWVRLADADLRRILPGLPPLASGLAITEKRATVASHANRLRPDCGWLWRHNIYPAGDYLHPRYPATLEAAVQSGRAAAERLLAG